MNMVQGKATDTDKAIIGKSDGAITLLTAIEGNKKAWENVKSAAGRELRSEAPMQNEGDSSATLGMTSGDNATVTDGELYSNGTKVSIPEKARIAKNIILDENSSKFRERDAKGYKVMETLAQDLGKKVKFVKGLTDEDGNQLDGAITEAGIFINIDGENPVRWAATHEFSHAIKQSAAESWGRYQEYVVARMKKDGSYDRVFNAKAKAYGTTDAAYINEEIAADYIGDLFSDVDNLADFIRESRRDAVTIRDWWYNVLTRLGLHGEKKKAQLMWRDAYREAVLNVKEGNVESTGEVKYSKEYSFNKQVDDALNNKIPRGYSVYVGKLPKLLAKCGLNSELDLIMNSSHIRNINHELDPNNDHYHGISDDMIKRIPEFLKNPAMIYDSISEDNKENSVCILTPECDSEGNPIIIVVTNSNVSNKYRNVEMKVIKSKASNHVDTMYGRKGFTYHMQDVIEQDAVLYFSKNKIEKLLNRKNLRLNSDGKLQLLARLDNLRSDIIIHQSRNVVNTNPMQKGEKNTRKSVVGTRLGEFEGEEILRDAQNDNADSGFISPGAEPRRDVKVPKSVKKGTKVRQFARTAAEAETLSDETAEGVLENVDKGKFSYTPVSDKSAMNNAYATMDTMGVEWVEKKVTDAIGSHSLDKNTVAMAEVLMQKYSEEGQQEKAQQLIIDFAAEGTRMGQSIQAISMLKKLDKNYEVAYNPLHLLCLYNHIPRKITIKGID